MATTVPDNIRTPDPGDPYNLVSDLATLAGDVQAALILRDPDPQFFTGTSTDRTAFTSTATAGMLWQDTDSIKMIWRKDGAAWVPAVWHWSGTTAQMNAFAAPNGFTWRNTTDNSNYVRLGGAWVADVRLRASVHGINIPVSTSNQRMRWDVANASINVGGFFNPATDTRIIIPEAGTYFFSYVLNTNGVAASGSRLYINNVLGSPSDFGDGAVGASSAASILNSQGLLSLNAGDYLEVNVLSATAPGGSFWNGLSNFSIFRVA